MVVEIIITIKLHSILDYFSFSPVSSSFWLILALTSSSFSVRSVCVSELMPNRNAPTQKQETIAGSRTAGRQDESKIVGGW
jgi:hypothetical protein